MSSPLNKLADALPSFILQMQDIKTRQEYYEALATYRTGMLAETIRTNELKEGALRATEQRRKELGYDDPPIVDVLGRQIEKDLDILRDPNITFDLGVEDINVIKHRVIRTQAEIRRQSKREYYVDPALIKIMGKEEPSPPATIAPPIKKRPTGEEIREEIPPRIGETEASYRRRLDPAAIAVAAGTKELLGVTGEIPPGFPDPSTLTEGQTATFNGEPWVIRDGQWVEAK